MSDPVRWGFLSTALSNAAVITSVRESPQVELAAVASRDHDRARGLTVSESGVVVIGQGDNISGGSP